MVKAGLYTVNQLLVITLWLPVRRTQAHSGRSVAQICTDVWDYPKHTLAHPPSSHHTDSVENIIYLDNINSCGVATALVPRQGDADPAYSDEPICKMPGVGSLPWINDRNSAEEYLAAHAPEDKEALRVNILHIGLSWAIYEKNMMLERLIAKLSVEQRCVLGFLSPGHRYWTDYTLP